jgi:predicted transcriptional regulator
MRTVTFEVASFADVGRRAREAAKTGKRQRSRVTFASAELLFRVMTERRWELIRAMAGAGAMSLREVARRLDRDVKTVHGDVHALLNAGVLHKTDEGQLEFPFDAVHVDFVVRAA